MFNQIYSFARKLCRKARVARSARIARETCEPRGSQSPLTTEPALAVVRKARAQAIAKREATPPSATRRYGRACMEVAALTSLELSLVRHS